VAPKERRTEMKYEVIEFGSSADTYEVEATSEQEAEDLVGEGKGTLLKEYNQHDFYEVSEAANA
jgi:hypothetical protein